MHVKPSLAALLLMGLTAAPAFAAFDTHYDQGDLILGLMSLADSSNVEANLGSVLALKALTSTTLLGNLGSAASAINATWYDNTGFVFGIGNANNSQGGSPGIANAAGDFNNTVYVSRARNVTASGGIVGQANSTAWPAATNPNLIQGAADMNVVGTVFRDNGGLSSGLLTVANSVPNNWADPNFAYNTATSGSTTSWEAFTGTNNTNYKFTATAYGTSGALANFAGLTGVQGVVDVYRVPYYGSALSTPGVQDGVTNFFGSVALTQTGDVYWIAAVPEPGSALLLVTGASMACGFLRPRRRAAKV